VAFADGVKKLMGPNFKTGPDLAPANFEAPVVNLERTTFEGAPRSFFRPTRMILVIGLLAIAILFAATAWMILQLQARELKNATRELTTLDLILVEDSERALQAVDLVLRNMQDRFVIEKITTDEELRTLHGTQEASDRLAARTAGIPQIEAVELIDADGKLINSSRTYPPGEQDLSGRDYFKALRNAPKDKLYISEPAEDYGSGQPTIYLARRIEAPDGKFLGLIVGAIKLSHFENLYRALEIGDGAAVSLWRRDGTMLVRYPRATGAPLVFKFAPFLERPRFERPQVFEVEKSVLDGKARLAATVAGKQYPVVIDVAQSRDSLLADWRHISTLAIAGAMLCATAIMLVMWLVNRQFSSFEALRVAVRERDQAEAARAEIEAQLRQSQKLEAVGELTGGIAHDFNNLLTAVMGNLELLGKHIGDEPRLQRWAKSALEAAKRGATLTQRLLAFSRRQPLDPKAADIGQLLDGLSDLLNRTLGENIDIRVSVTQGLWPAFIDVNQLDSALLNVAINARDAMAGKGRLTIAADNIVIDALEATRHKDLNAGDYVAISLTDTGNGIPPEILERVFEPFFTTKPIGQGTGLGLSQVYGFLKQTGGGISISSVPGEGTTVRLYLPRAAPRIEEPASEAAQPAASVADIALPPQANKRILVVEDDGAVRAYTVEILGGLGFEVLQAVDAFQALETLRKTAGIGLMMTDIGLPGMNGRDLAVQVKKQWPDLRVLFTSGYARQAIVHNDRLDDGVELLVKPFSRDDLAMKLERVLRGDAKASMPETQAAGNGVA